MNSNMSKLLRELGDLSSLAGEVKFKSMMYYRAADTVGELDVPISSIDPSTLHGIKTAISGKIGEIINTGTCIKLERLRKRYGYLLPIMKISGIGPTTALRLNKDYKVKSVSDIERLINRGVITNKSIIEGVCRQEDGRLSKDEASHLAEKVVARLKNTAQQVGRIKICGSLRRKEDTIGDIDIIIETNRPNIITKAAESLLEVVSDVGKLKVGGTISNTHIDFRIADVNSFGAMILYFTGSKGVNIELRKAAASNGLKLNEYGLWKKNSWTPHSMTPFPFNRFIAGTEKDIFKHLGYKYLEPHDRYKKNIREL